jgi:glycosyltransferase involved in cell wall biosynthesis
MKRIRILYTIPNFDTAGSGIALLKLASRLDKDRFEPMIVCLHDRGSLFKAVQESGMPVFIHPYLCDLKPRMRFIGHVMRTASFFRKTKADIIYSYHYAPNPSEAFAAKLAGKKFVYVKKNMGWKGGSYNQWRIRSWLSDAIVAQNSDMMSQFFPGMRKAQLLSIGVDLEEFHPRVPDVALRQELGIPEGRRIVLCVANLAPKKGIDHLLRGFANINGGPDAQLVIVGKNDNELWEPTISLVRDLDIESRVTFTGKRMDVSRFFSIADVFILPSTGDEGAPIAVQEAMASGVPVITTDTPGNRDQVKGFPEQMIPPSDPDSIGVALLRMLMLDPRTRQNVVDRQLGNVRLNYSLEQEVKRHEELYTRLMGR